MPISSLDLRSLPLDGSSLTIEHGKDSYPRPSITKKKKKKPRGKEKKPQGRGPDLYERSEMAGILPALTDGDELHEGRVTKIEDH
jgi:hypothetical protein